MKSTTRWLLIALAGLVLLVGPVLLRMYWLGYTTRSYVPTTEQTAAIAATPVPTATPVAQALPPAPPQNELKRGAVVVDLAHGSRIARSRFQPLASALSARGLEVIFWTPSFDMNATADPTQYPDQSDALTQVLLDASAFFVVSPYYLYNEREAAVVEKFVADGGHLVMISDPDVEGDLAQDLNPLAAPFGIVFNEDYLYDTVDNDANFTHFFQGEFSDRAEGLAGSRIAFYGGRSISGALIPQARTASTALSSLRSGQTDLVTVAIGGQVANNSLGRVLAMSDFDVLTEPFVDRFENRNMLDFVANFLTGAQRTIRVSALLPATRISSVARRWCRWGCSTSGNWIRRRQCPGIGSTSARSTTGRCHCWAASPNSSTSAPLRRSSRNSGRSSPTTPTGWKTSPCSWR